ncbi:hypothetical protein Leryth_002492 [Lithospermum erythrorhizon]|nr:hypothetical protein Leryth_002492 [Lithospermum erythrorhizon]
MDQSDDMCTKKLSFNPVLSMSGQSFAILVISHIFQILLKPLGLPAPVAQILVSVFQEGGADYFEALALYARIYVMFLIGLEMDFQYLKRKKGPACIISGASLLACTLFAAGITSFVYQETKEVGEQGNGFLIFVILTVVLANTASPLVIRIAADMKFINSELGRLVVSSSMIGDAYAVVLLLFISNRKERNTVMQAITYEFYYLIIVAAFIFLNIYVVGWLNRRNRNRKYLKNFEICILLALVFFCTMFLETLGYSSIVASFMLGALFPRRGKSFRTLLIKLSYLAFNFVFPIYFGFIGFRADITDIDSLPKFAIVVIVMLLSIGGKVGGTLAACYNLKIPLNEGVLISFLMNMKGHVDLAALTVGKESNVIFTQSFYKLMLTTIALNSIIFGVIIAFMVKKEPDIFGYKNIPFEAQNPESELRLLACVYNPRPVTTMIGLIASSRGSENVSITPYFVHLIELPEKKNMSNLMYHQKEEEEISDDEDYGGNDVVEINETIDIFTEQSKLMIHQTKAVAPFSKMYEDVCDYAEDIRASMVILPFHKHQRIDGKLESGKEGVRTTNQKVLRHAKCSVAILVDRGLTAASSQTIGASSLQHTATLFFGGPDDREALGFSKRLGLHHHTNLTIIRFLPESEKKIHLGINVSIHEEDVLMAVSEYGTEEEKDNAALGDFYNRYVTSGQVGYVEKHVENGTETASALRDMAEMYSMIIVGKGGRGSSPLTTGLSDWEECPELGTIGDFLASAEFDNGGSVLLVQQYKSSRSGIIDDE